MKPELVTYQSCSSHNCSCGRVHGRSVRDQWRQDFQIRSNSSYRRLEEHCTTFTWPILRNLNHSETVLSYGINYNPYALSIFLLLPFDMDLLWAPSVLSASCDVVSNDADCLEVIGSKSKTWTLMSQSFWTTYAQAVFGDSVGFQDGGGGQPGPGLPPGTPPTGMTARSDRHF